jgi:thiamine-phosphate pyrophosphorylase
VKQLAECRLYGILDLGYVAGAEMPAMAARMIDGGVDILQLRAKGAQEDEVERCAGPLQAICESAGVPLIINDFPQLVPSVGARGAHVGQDDYGVEDARWRAGRALAGEVERPWVGKSTHSVIQAMAAEGEGADYIGFGPLYATPTKPGRPAVGLEDVARVHAAVKIPVFCIGGIKWENLAQVIDAGARRVVIVSGILRAPDVTDYCRRVRGLLG